MTLSIRPLNQPLTLVEITETPETLTLTQTRVSALRDLRNLLIRTWSVPFALFAVAFAHAEFFSPFWNHGEKTSSEGWYDPFYPWTISLFVVLIGRLLLPAICGLFGRATFVFDKGQGVLLRNGRQVGPLQEIHAIKPQVSKGAERNPVFRLVLELPQRRKVVVAETHHIPERGEFQVSRNPMGPNSAFTYLHCWLNYDRQRFVPFLDPEIAEIERRITQFLGT